jgi:hypothetical protein
MKTKLKGFAKCVAFIIRTQKIIFVMNVDKVYLVNVTNAKIVKN